MFLQRDEAGLAEVRGAEVSGHMRGGAADVVAAAATTAGNPGLG